MRQLKKLFVLLLLVGFSASSIASVSGVKITSCSVYSEGETAPETTPETDGDKTTEEEEPDCEQRVVIQKVEQSAVHSIKI